MSESEDDQIYKSAGLSAVEMFRVKNPFYRSFEKGKRECREKGYPVHKEWTGPGKYPLFHACVLKLLGLEEQDKMPTASLPKCTIQMIEPEKGLVPDNLKTEITDKRIISMRRLVSDIDLKKLKEARPKIKDEDDDDDDDDEEEEESDLDPTRLSGGTIVKNTQNVYPRPRLRTFSDNFVDKEGNINPEHNPEDSDAVSVRQYMLGDPKAAEKGIDLDEELEECKIINFDYGTDNLDIADRIFSVFGKVADPSEVKPNAGLDLTFDEKIQRIIAKHSHDPEIQRLAWEETYWMCYLPDCHNLVAEEGLCFRHMIGKRMYEQKQKLAKEQQENPDKPIVVVPKKPYSGMFKRSSPNSNSNSNTNANARPSKMCVTTDAKPVEHRGKSVKLDRLQLPNLSAFPETDPEVERDLDELFGTSIAPKP